MKTPLTFTLAVLALGATAAATFAQPADAPPPGERQFRPGGGPAGPGAPGGFGGGQGEFRGPGAEGRGQGFGGPGGQPGFGGPGREGFRPPTMPLMEALDANRDGVLSAAEIANATSALKKLDKDNDGELSPEELRPTGRPGGFGGGPGGGG
ncbi:MAG: hypothetical protein AB1705_28320, partial [Verrucomicrobiota bacterium]